MIFPPLCRGTLSEDKRVPQQEHCQHGQESLASAPARPTPLAAPRSGHVQTQGGGMAVVKLAPKLNLSAPNFFGDRRSGYAINLANFLCNLRYTCTFDIARNCRICPNEHEAFPSNLVGTLVVGDSYTPCIIGGGGKCVPVFR